MEIFPTTPPTEKIDKRCLSMTRWVLSDVMSKTVHYLSQDQYDERTVASLQHAGNFIPVFFTHKGDPAGTTKRVRIKVPEFFDSLFACCMTGMKEQHTATFHPGISSIYNWTKFVTAEKNRIFQWTKIWDFVVHSFICDQLPLFSPPSHCPRLCYRRSGCCQGRKILDPFEPISWQPTRHHTQALSKILRSAGSMAIR